MHCFPNILTKKENAAWRSFIAMVDGFLCNHRAEYYVQLVRTLVRNYHKIGCRMSLKIHILDAHLNSFKDNMGSFSEEQGERFHQDMNQLENPYQGQCSENMMGDYI